MPRTRVSKKPSAQKCKVKPVEKPVLTIVPKNDAPEQPEPVAEILPTSSDEAREEKPSRNYIDVFGKFHIYVMPGQYSVRRVNSEGKEGVNDWYDSSLEHILKKILFELTRKEIGNNLKKGCMELREAVDIQKAIAAQINSYMGIQKTEK